MSRGEDGNEDVCSDTTHSEILSELAEQDTIYVGGDHSTLSSTVTIGEEAFAILVFENNFKRWI